MFPEDTAIPLDAIALFWAETGGLSPGRAKKLADELDHRRLSRRQWTYAGPMVDLHDVVRTLLRLSCCSRSVSWRIGARRSARSARPVSAPR